MSRQSDADSRKWVQVVFTEEPTVTKYVGAIRVVENDRVYFKPMEEAQAREEFLAQRLRLAHNELRAFRAKYRDFEEFSELFSKIDKLPITA